MPSKRLAENIISFRKRDLETLDGAGLLRFQVPRNDGGGAHQQSCTDHGEPGRAPALVCFHGQGFDRTLEIGTKVADVTTALLRVLLEATGEKLAHPRAELGRKRPKVGIAPHDRCHRVGDILSLEELSSREHLVEDGAEGEDICALVDGPSPRLLRAHVSRRSKNDADPCRVRAQGWGVRDAFANRVGIGLREPSEAEVEHLDLSVRCDLDVDGF